jgi:hypothetical protein
MILVIEGPDGNGKTTLADYLVKEYGAAYFHATYRKNAYWAEKRINLYHWSILLKAVKESHRRLVVIDRLWLSESIYGPVCRKVNKPGYGRPFAAALEALGAIQIFCLGATPGKTFERFLESRKKRDEMWTDNGQMEVVCWTYWAYFHGSKLAKQHSQCWYDLSYPSNNYVSHVINSGGAGRKPLHYAWDFDQGDLESFVKNLPWQRDW